MAIWIVFLHQRSVFSHRLTTLQNCDEIIVMDKGQIVQRGTFAQLKATPGIFQDMANGILK